MTGALGEEWNPLIKIHESLGIEVTKHAGTMMTGRRTCILEISETVTPRQKCRRLALWLCSEPTGVTGLAEEVREFHAHLAKPIVKPWTLNRNGHSTDNVSRKDEINFMLRKSISIQFSRNAGIGLHPAHNTPKKRYRAADWLKVRVSDLIWTPIHQHPRIFG